MNITLKEFFLKTEEEKSPEKAIRELNKLVSKTYNHIINKNDYSSDYEFDKIINDFTDELIEVTEFILQKRTDLINKIIENLQTEKIGTIVHICGQMRSVYKEVNMINSDVFSFDSIVSMKNARENLPNRILMGNISTYALEFGTPDKISSLTNKCIKDGSNIISPACGLGTKSPLKNIQSILNTLKQEETKINA